MASPCFASGPDRKAKGREEAAGIDDPIRSAIRIRFASAQIDLDLDGGFRSSRDRRDVAILDIQRQPGCPPDAPLVLDTRGLTIEEVGLRKLTIVPQRFVADAVSSSARLTRSWARGSPSR